MTTQGLQRVFPVFLAGRADLPMQYQLARFKASFNDPRCGCNNCYIPGKDLTKTGNELAEESHLNKTGNLQDVFANDNLIEIAINAILTDDDDATSKIKELDKYALYCIPVCILFYSIFNIFRTM